MDRFVGFRKCRDNTNDRELQSKKARKEDAGVKVAPNDTSQHTGDKWSRPLLKNYPKQSECTSQGRAFVASWYERYNYRVFTGI